MLSAKEMIAEELEYLLENDERFKESISIWLYDKLVDFYEENENRTVYKEVYEDLVKQTVIKKILGQ